MSISTKTVFVSVVFLSMFLAACSAFPPKDSLDNPSGRKIHGHADISKGEIAPAMLADKLQRGGNIILLDVREAEEYEEVHIPGTTHRISSKEFSPEKLAEAGIKKDDEIIVYCRSGARGRVAAKKMREWGYTNVWELNSGIIHWLEDGFPSEKGGDETLKGESGDEREGSGGTVDIPKISFDRLAHDFGEIPQFGGKVSTTFAVRNEGSADLMIGEITTSCSCTEATIEKTLIPAGDQAVLTVTFDPNLHEEPREKFKRTIFLPTNDPKKSEAELTIEVDILEGSSFRSGMHHELGFRGFPSEWCTRKGDECPPEYYS